MKKYMIQGCIGILVCLVLGAAGGAAAVEVGQPAPGFILTDIEGNVHALKDYRGKVVVLEWFNHGCPFVRKFYASGRMQEWQAQLTREDVVWLSINSTGPGRGAFTPPEKARAQAKDLQVHSTAVLLDPEGTVGKAYGARTTPHGFVVAADGTLAYAGAIDDQPTPDPGTLDQARNYVVEAVQALKAGKPVPEPHTRPYGCGIKYAK